MKKHIRLSPYKLVYILLDLLIAFVVSLGSFLSYYKPSGFVQNNHWVVALIYSGAFSFVLVLVLAFVGAYRIITKQFSFIDSLRIMLPTFFLQIISLIVISLVSVLPRFTDYIFSWGLTTITLLFLHPLVRVIVRISKVADSISKKENRVRTIVIGAGATGKVVVDETRRNKDNHNYIVAMVDDDPNKIGGLFSGIPVKGPISDIAKIIDYTKAEEVIIAMSLINKEQLHKVLGYLSSSNVRVRRMPLIGEMQGPNDTRVIDVDLDDLLSRDKVILDNSKTFEMLNGKCVLITGLAA